MHVFDESLGLQETGPHHWSVTVSPAWNIGSSPNGGFLQALTVAAMGHELAHPDPLTVTTHFFGRVDPGHDATITVEPIHDGRTTSSAAAKLIQGGKERLRSLGTFADLDTLVGRTAVRAYPPDFPPPEECLSGDQSDAPFEFFKQFDFRFDPELAHSSATEIGGWIRFLSPRDPDLASLSVFADSFPPTVLSLGSFGWVPTIELTVHFRAKPEPGWLQCLFTTQLIRDGHFEEDGLIWDSSGRAVAQSRQLGRILHP